MSVDPLAEKYYAWSGYNYVADNPLKFIDFDGRDYGVYINHGEQTITISANYTSFIEGQSEFLDKGIDYWNSQSEKYNYVVGKGKDAQTYSIVFNLEPNNGDSSTPEETNNYQVLPDEYVYKENVNDDGTTTKRLGGSDGNSVVISESNKENEETNAHEIGHTLGIDSHSQGIMSPDINGNLELTNKHVNQILGNAGLGKLRFDKGESNAKATIHVINATDNEGNKKPEPNNFDKGKVNLSPN